MDFIKALQLYSVKEETARDFVGSLEKVAHLGYDAVEFAGYGGLSASEMKSHLDRVGLIVYGSHVGYDRLINNLDEEIEYNLALNNGYIVLPGYPFKNADDFKNLALTLNVIGEKCKKSGIQFCYHNHFLEFKSFDGKLGMDILLDETEPSFLKAEIDTYWVQYAGINVVEYIGKLKDRCPLLHLKDMVCEEGHESTEIGNGILDFKSIISKAQIIGTEALIVEQEHFRMPLMESVGISIKNLNNLLK